MCPQTLNQEQLLCSVCPCDAGSAWTPSPIHGGPQYSPDIQKLCPQPQWRSCLSLSSAGLQQLEAPAHPHTELCSGAAEGMQGRWDHQEGEQALGCRKGSRRVQSGVAEEGELGWDGSVTCMGVGWAESCLRRRGELLASEEIAAGSSGSSSLSKYTCQVLERNRRLRRCRQSVSFYWPAQTESSQRLWEELYSGNRPALAALPFPTAHLLTVSQGCLECPSTHS